MSLTETEVEILDFERSWFKFAGAKEQEIYARFDLGATRYYQVLNALLDRPEALQHDPMLVRRLQRLRDTRKQHRSQTRMSQ